MARKFLQPIDMTQLEVLNLRLQQLSSDPTPVSGQLWYRTDTAKPRWYDGTTSQYIWPFATTNAINTGVLRDGSGNFAAGTITAALTGTASNATQLNGQVDTFYLSRANHTGTQLANTISNFDTQVRTSRLDQMSVPTASVSMNSQLLTSLLDPVNPQDAATKAYVDAISTGLDIKGSVRVVTIAALPTYTRTGNVITASANGALATIDSVTLVLNDRLLLKNGSTGSDNGLYFVSQVGTAGTPYTLTRTTDADTSVEVTGGLFTFVEEGTTFSDTGWVLTTNNPITLNTTGLTFTQFSGAGSLVAGNGITITGVTISTQLAARLVFNGTAIDLASGIVAAGTYTSVTVDTYGRTTAGADITAGTGLVTKTAAGTFTGRTVTGTASRTTVTNGDGVAGNPTIDINTSYVGQSSITTLGTITTGVWTGTSIAAANGGTGINGVAAANGTLLIGNGSGYTLAALTAGTNISVTNGAGTITIATGTTVLTGTLVSGRVPFANGTQSLTDSSTMTFSTTSGFNVNRASGSSQSLMLGTNSGNAAMTGANNITIGQSAGVAIAAGTGNVVMGSGAGAITSGSNNLVLGTSAGQTLDSGVANILLGALTDVTSAAVSNTFVAGSNNGGPINDVYFGKGMAHAAATAYTINGTGGTGTDNAGASVILAGGRGTGTGVGGSLVIRTAAISGTGSTQNALVDRLSVLGDGGVRWTGITTSVAPAVAPTNTGIIYYDQTLQAFMASTNSGAYATLSVGGIGGALVAGRITLSNGASSVTDNANLTYTGTTGLSVAASAVATGTQVLATFTGAANTNQTTTSEVSDVVLNLARTVQWATGAIATQRAVRIMAPTYAFVGASTITNAATFAVSGSPVAGTNATLTNAYAVWVQSGVSRFDGNLSVNDASNVVLGTTTGTQIGTSTSQKLAFFGSTPVVQQIGDIRTALSALGLVTTATLALANVTGTVAATNGGTGFNGGAAANGQLAIGNGSGFTLASLTAGTGISITPGAGTITIAATGAGTVAKFATSIGNGALTTFTITHNLGSLDVTCTIYAISSGEEVIADVIHATTNTLTVNFAVAPTTNQYRVVVTG